MPQILVLKVALEQNCGDLKMFWAKKRQHSGLIADLLISDGLRHYSILGLNDNFDLIYETKPVTTFFQMFWFV